MEVEKLNEDLNCIGGGPMPCEIQQPSLTSSEQPSQASNKQVSSDGSGALGASPPLTSEQLINDHRADPELQTIIVQHAGKEHDVRDSPVSHFMKNGVLFRKWRSPTVLALEEWETVYQIVVPQNCCAEVIKLAHSTPLAGHLGVSKTCSRILSHFYWPGIRSDARKFCRECHVC